MILSFMAGIMICISAVIYLQVGGIAGAFLFSIGLLTILTFGLNLFTGKAGKLVKNEITVIELCKIWFGNFLGCIVGAELIHTTDLGSKIFESAAAITNVRVTNLWYENLILGIFCGILMFIAVSNFNKMPYLTIMCVMGFIMMGANHCIADMAYFTLGGWQTGALSAIFWTTIGNLIGCNVFNLIFDINEKGWI